MNYLQLSKNNAINRTKIVILIDQKIESKKKKKRQN